MAWIKLYETYNKVKNVFIKPKLYFKFGLWKNDPCLPIWRRGPIISLFSSKFVYKHSYQVRSYVNITEYKKGDKMKNGKIAECNYGTYNIHKLPNKLEDWDRIWHRDFRKKLKKWHLSWIKPNYQLPIWCSFYVFNRDFIWKTKWSSYDFRYEFPPQFTLVLFGFSFSLWLKFPGNSAFSNDQYWEGILHYLYGEKSLDLKSAIQECGKWSKRLDKDIPYTYWSFEKTFLRPEYWKEYDKAIEELEVELYRQKEKEDETE